jgi:hypothetical protein
MHLLTPAALYTQMEAVKRCRAERAAEQEVSNRCSSTLMGLPMQQNTPCDIHMATNTRLSVHLQLQLHWLAKLELAYALASRIRCHARHAAVCATLHLPRACLQEASKVEAGAMAIYQQNQQLNKQQLALNSEVKALKAQANQLADQAAQQKFELMNAQQENERLQSQVVQVRHGRSQWQVTAHMLPKTT